MNGIATPSELEMLRRIFDDHCQRAAVIDARERDNVAAFLMTVFGKGIRDQAELMRELNGKL